VTTVKAAIDAYDSAIGEASNHINSIVDRYKNDPVATDPYGAAMKKAASMARLDDMQNAKAGIASLDLQGNVAPLTLGRVEQLRQRLRAELDASLAENNYDQAVARKSSPGFAAKEAAYHELVRGEFDHLEQVRGIPPAEVSALRTRMGDMIDVRNALQRQYHVGGQNLPGTGDQSLPARIIRAGGPVAGAALGGSLFSGAGEPGIIGGATGGGVIGTLIADRIVPAAISRDSVVADAFSKLNGMQGVTFGPNMSPGMPRTQLPPGPVVTPAPQSSYAQSVGAPPPGFVSPTFPQRQIPATTGVSSPQRLLPESSFMRVAPDVSSSNPSSVQSMGSAPPNFTSPTFPQRQIPAQTGVSVPQGEPPSQTFQRVEPETEDSSHVWSVDAQGNRVPMREIPAAKEPTPTPQENYLIEIKGEHYIFDPKTGKLTKVQVKNIGGEE
jgi:hypothetical protein